MENVVVPGWSSVTADQMKEFWEKASRKQIGLRNFQAFLDNPNKFSDETSGLISISQAKKILGRRKVITVTLFNNIWQTSHNDALIFYSEEDFIDAARRNKEEGDDWRLIYYSGQSIRKLRKIIGTDKEHQPCFYKQDWYFDERQDFWADKTPLAGYYLINFKGLFSMLNYQEQESEMFAKFDGGFERTDPHIFTETAMTIFKLTGERIAENWYHRPFFCTVDGHRVFLGHFDAEGWHVNIYWGDVRLDPIFRVSVSRKQNLELIVKEKIDSK